MEGEPTKVTKIDLGSDESRGARGTVGENGLFYCFGVYAPTESRRINGMFYTRINSKTDEIELSEKHEFTAADLANIPKEDKKVKDKDGEASLDYFVYRDIFVQADGSLLVTAEQYSSGVVSTGKHTFVVFNAFDIFNFNILPDGKIAWLNVISKKQSFGIGEYVSYARINNAKGNAHFFYNDNPDNVALPMDKPAKRMGLKTAVCLTTMAPDGKIKRNMFSQTREIEERLSSQECVAIGQDKMFLLLAKYPKVGKPSYRFGIVDL